MNDFTKNITQALFNQDKINDLLRHEIQQAVNDLLESELTAFLGYDPDARDGWNTGNSRNGAYFRKVDTQFGEIEIQVPRDLNCYYPIVARELFSNAQIVINRFHMVQMLTRSFNSLRVQTMKQFKKQSREYKLLKSTWKLYLMKYDKLNKKTPYYDWHFKDYLTQEHVVLDGLDCSKELENTYWIMQDFMTAIQSKDEKQIIHLLHSKQAIDKQMHQTLLTFKHNYTGVLNGISSSYSNGCLEGVNRKIKQIERTAYGYSSFSHLLIRIRLEENIVKEKESNNYSLVA
ncbi:transposase [Lactobacillus helveticus]|uniref:transposase n=1 Tax=Lactobacillus helveticus TaxID=1587 RepID=UPI00345EE8D8